MTGCTNVSLFLIVLLVQLCRGANGDCSNAVAKSVVYVPFCPTSMKERDRAANIKNCSKLATQQNCSDVLDYHCVINGFRNETLEVCATKRLIAGFCTEFNVAGGVIQSHSSAPCNKMTFPKCDIHYNSSEAYKYPGCYELVYKNGRNKTIKELTNQRNTTSDQPENGDNTGIITAGILVPLFIVTVIVIGVFIYKRKKKRRQNGTTKTKGEIAKLIPETHELAKAIKPEKAKDNDVTTGTDKYTYKTDEDDREENNAESIKFLRTNKKMDQFFVETDSYKKAESTFNKNGIVVFTGPPGCGKTIAAIHLIRKELRDWTFRKIRSWNELSYIAEDTKSLVFIDNIFFRRTMDSDLENWWDKFDKIHEKYFASDDVEVRMKHLRIIMTARPHVIEKACSYMGKVTPILNEQFLIDASKLTYNEKDQILENQILFAERENQKHVPVINDSFKKEVKHADGPIGFPLCAHLYVFTKDYQKSGAQFFSRPIEYLKLQIGDEIENDKTNKTKSLFFFMFFFDWHTRVGKMEKLDLKSSSSCKGFLNKISPDLIKKFDPFDFNGLEEKAQKLSGAFFKEVGEAGEHKYKFVHDSVHEAVGAYFCEKYFTETAKHFPLDLIQNQVNENLNNSQKVTLATRLLYEALDQQLSQVFACKIFRKKEFSTFFYSELQKKDSNTVDLFLTVTNESSIVKLPTLFWTSCNNIFPLTELLYGCVKERNLSPEYQLYVLLFGMCCARREGVLKTVNGMFRNNIEMLQNRVLAFKDDEGNYIPHIIIASDSSDEFTLNALKEILQKNEGIATERNKQNMTLLMIAVKQTLTRVNVIEYLMKASPPNHLLYKDINGSTVLHHLLGSENDDETCAQYLDTILKNDKAKKCLPKDDFKGDTALSIAAKETRHSRILSILKLLESSECIVETLNEVGCSPLHLSASSLKRDTPFLKVECCTRVIILLLYGASPNKQTDKSDVPVDECKYEGVRTILKNPLDKKNMENILSGYLKDIDNWKDCQEYLKHGLKLPSKFSQGIQKGILKAVQCLKNIEFETSA